MLDRIIATFISACDICYMIEWFVLTASLPSSPSGLRVRIWRALRATSCATLRDGVYILPASAPSASDLWAIAKAIQDGGADAHRVPGERGGGLRAGLASLQVNGGLLVRRTCGGKAAAGL